MLGTAIFIRDEKEGVHVEGERRRRSDRVIDSGPFFRRGPDVTTVPQKRVQDGYGDLTVRLARPDDRIDGAPSNVGKAKIKRVYRTAAADERVDVAVYTWR